MSSYKYFKYSTQTNEVVWSTLSELSYKYDELFMFLVLVSTILMYFLGKMNNLNWIMTKSKCTFLNQHLPY